jgi:hypothetical protein
MNPQHTPAPWSLGSNGATTKVVDADGKAICMITYRKDHWNGDLLAAAPDLLIALQDLLNATEATYDNRHEREAALDAIAKATGDNT